MTRYKIYQCYADDTKWFQISVERFLELTEGKGAFKKDTALEALKYDMQIRTDFSFFKIANPSSFPF